MDLTQYRQRDLERQRTADLLQLVERARYNDADILDIGARDGHFSMLFAPLFRSVTALDLTRPAINAPNVQCVQGDITQLSFAENSFDVVFCTEVLEHIPPHLLLKACAEVSRVCRDFLIIGVPYKQDLRVGRTTCTSCGRPNPPWGHVNSFDDTIVRLFPDFRVNKISFIGQTRATTNAFAKWLLDLAGNPYGAYSPDEQCLHCSTPLTHAPRRNLLQKAITKVALYSQYLQTSLHNPHPNWIHVLLQKTKRS